MTVALVGAVCSNCDTASDFTTINSGVNISTDDANVQGAGGAGDKISNTTEVIASDTLLGGAAGVYDFSSGGADEGAHFIGWANTKTPINATTGIACYFRNASGHLGTWNSIPSQFYNGGFVLRVQDPAADFNAATTWLTTSNPAQLDDVSAMGFEFTTTTSIMGNFNNCQVDQFTVGYGLRVSVGTSGTPIAFSDVTTFDIDTNFYGWWSTFAGQNIGRGKLYVGPETGDANCYFHDSSFSVVFADEQVATDFYEFDIRGANTSVEWTLGNISSGNPTLSRFAITLEAAMGSAAGYGFVSTGGAWTGGRVLTLNQYALVDGTAMVDCSSLIQNGANLANIIVREANTAVNVAFVTANNISLMTGGDHEVSSLGGHAIELTATGTYNSVDNRFTSYGIDASSNAAIYNNSGGAITINVSGTGLAAEHTVRNGAGATTTIIATVDVKIDVQDTSQIAIEGAQIYIQNDPAVAYTSGAGNIAGDATLVLTQTIAVDVPQSSLATVYDRSENLTFPYRFISHDGTNTLTFPAELTGSLTANANPADSETVISTTTNFLTADVEEGDTIRNTTDGSYAVIDEIVDADNITTSRLQGGSDNLWQSGDSFSLHRLATTLVSGTDTVDVMLFNGQSNTLGQVATSYPQSQVPEAIAIRTRKVQGSPKYISQRQTGTITSSGFNLLITLSEDDQA